MTSGHHSMASCGMSCKWKLIEFIEIGSIFRVRVWSFERLLKGFCVAFALDNFQCIRS